VRFKVHALSNHNQSNHGPDTSSVLMHGKPTIDPIFEWSRSVIMSAVVKSPDVLVLHVPQGSMSCAFLA
jgi:hypothetical protein